MRAKLKVVSTELWTEYVGENVKFTAVGPDGSYPDDGTDENNSYARWTPSASLSMSITNPNLIGKFKIGDTFYVDFTPAQNV